LAEQMKLIDDVMGTVYLHKEFEAITILWTVLTNRRHCVELCRYTSPPSECTNILTNVWYRSRYFCVYTTCSLRMCM